MANADNAAIGQAYSEHVETWLTSHGYEIKESRLRHESGVEFDLYAIGPDGDAVGIECKASEPGATSPGMARSDNRWKVLGYLHALRWWLSRNPTERVRYVLVTSHLPEPGSTIRDMLDHAELLGEMQVIHVPWNGRGDQ